MSRRSNARNDDSREPLDGVRPALEGGGNAAEAAAAVVSMVPGLRLFLGLASAALIIAGLYFGRSLLIPLALAALFGFLLEPLVRRLARWGLPRLLAVGLVVLFVLGLLVGLGAYVTTQLTALSADLPTYQSTIRTKLHALRQVASKPGAWEGALKTLETVQAEIDKTPTGAAVSKPQRVEIVGEASRPTHVALEWLSRVSEPVATAGIALLFVILILLDRRDLRDRLLRLAGGDLHTATDAMDEASDRIGRYLRMQLLINASLAVPMGLGLWWIGVPAAALWGLVAAVLRFVPYVGPIVSAVFPIALAFAVSPDWSMVLWTIGLVVTLELISGNVLEPWLYGSSTGLSAISIIAAAMFWTALWGPIGLILSTPMTVCIYVIGRYLPSLRFLEVLLGSEDALDPPRRLYQRLLAGDVEEAVDLAGEAVEEGLRSGRDDVAAAAVADFYDDVALPMLRIATSHHGDAAAEHRLRLVNGLDELIDELREQYPEPLRGERALQVVCIGARWEIDVLAADMVAHALALRGVGATVLPHALSSSSTAPELPERLIGGVICLSVFGTQPQARVRLLARRLRRRLPQARLLVAAWNASGPMLGEDMPRRLGVDVITGGLDALVLHVDRLLRPDMATVPVPADDEARVHALHESGALAPENESLYRDVLRSVVNAFGTKYAEISWIDTTRARKPASVLSDAEGIPRELAVCSHVVGTDRNVIVPDIARDPRFADNPLLQEHGIRFYAGTPLHDREKRPLGALCIMDTVPHEMGEEDLALLAKMGEELMARLRKRATEIEQEP